MSEEYIDRGEALMKLMQDGCSAKNVESIMNIPAYDIVQVVSCCDCKHFRRNLENDTYCSCIGGLTDPEEHDFCSYGERRAE